MRAEEGSSGGTGQFDWSEACEKLLASLVLDQPRSLSRVSIFRSADKYML